MTYVNQARNVNEALENGLWHLHLSGILQDSRNGRVLRAPGPVITETFHPRERVLFSALRDANPFFHLLESFWMLAGRNDTASLTGYVARMQDFSDDGTTLNGAYGYRWREHFGYDQLSEVISDLRLNPNSRRAVVAMWDGGQQVHSGGSYAIDSDLLKAARGSKDVPCNTHLYFDVIDRKLNMTVCCRSNDAVWGAHGANAVHFSILQEYMALACGYQVGSMYQLSNNYHIYVDRPDTQRLFKPEEDGKAETVLYRGVDMYKDDGTMVLPLLQYKEDVRDLDLDIQDFFEYDGSKAPRTYFFQQVFAPLLGLHANYKAGVFSCKEDVTEWASHKLIGNCDWHRAGVDWVLRRT